MPHTQSKSELRAAALLIGILTTALLLWQPAPAGAKPGDLDPTFGDGGRWSAGTGIRASVVDMEIDRVGRILVAMAAGDQAGVFRLTSGGESDPSWGGSGFANTRLFTDAQGLAVDDAGRVVIAGSGSPIPNDPNDDGSSYAVRFTASGQLDATYSGDGKNNLGVAEVTDVEARPGGETVLALARSADADDVEVRQLDENGDDDASFSGDGAATVDLGAASDPWTAVDLALDADGNVLVLAGQDTGSGALCCTVVARLTPNGMLDTGFADGGLARFASSWGIGLAITTDAQDRIAVATRAGTHFKVVRLQADGAGDPSFGLSGIATSTGSTNEIAADIAAQANGKLLVSGNDAGGDAAWVSRLNVNGSTDPGFGNEGFVRTSSATNRELEVDQSGRILSADLLPVPMAPAPAITVSRFLGGEPTTVTPPGGVAGEAGGRRQEVRVHKLVVPKTRAGLFRRGIRALASCAVDCKLVLEVRVSEQIAAEMGLERTLLARAAKQASADKRRWLTARFKGDVRRGLASYSGGGRFEVTVTAKGDAGPFAWYSGSGGI